jgi:hypothetical protein
MNGKGAWRDNVFVERLWRTIKYEEVYLRAYASVSEARASLGRYIDGFYNTRRPIRALTGGRRTRPILPRCHQSRWQPNRGRDPLRKRPELFKQTEPPLRAKWQHHSALALPYRLRFLLRFAAAWRFQDNAGPLKVCRAPRHFTRTPSKISKRVNKNIELLMMPCYRSNGLVANGLVANGLVAN